MDDTSRDPAITEDEIRALQFSAGDVAEIEQTILSLSMPATPVKWRWWWVAPLTPSKIAMVNGGKPAGYLLRLSYPMSGFSRGISGIRRFVSYAL